MGKTAAEEEALAQLREAKFKQWSQRKSIKDRMFQVTSLVDDEFPGSTLMVNCVA